MKRGYYNIEFCRCFNNRPTDRWVTIQWFIPSLKCAREELGLCCGDFEYPIKHDECMNASPYQIVLADDQTFDMCDIRAFRIASMMNA